MLNVLCPPGRTPKSPAGERCAPGEAGGAVARAQPAAQRLEHEAGRAGQVQPAVRLAATQQRAHRWEQGDTFFHSI